MAKPQLHYSQINMLMRCPQQYYYRYIEGLKQKPGIALIVGSGTHRSVEANLKHKIDNDGNLMVREEALEVARDYVSNELESQEIEYKPDEVERGIVAVNGEAIDTAVNLSGLHYTMVAPNVSPVQVERKWVVSLDNFPFDLAGTIDIDEGDAIRDTKTSAKTPAKDEADVSVQLTAYALAKLVIDGQVPPRLYLDYLVKTKTPKYVSLESTRTPEQAERFLRLVEMSANVIEKEAFMPNNTGWWCSKRFCGYHNVCPYFSGRK